MKFIIKLLSCLKKIPLNIIYIFIIMIIFNCRCIMKNLDEKFADKLASLCYQKYSKLPKKGKPQKGKEWTIVAGILMTTQGKVLSLDSLFT